MSEPTKAGGFDPRRLADLASRLAPRPAPAEAAPPAEGPQPSAERSFTQQPSAERSFNPQPSAQRSFTQQPSAERSFNPQPEQARPSAAAGETAGPAGQPYLEAILAELERAEGLSPDRQIPVYESVHRTLQETLRSIEQS